MSFLTLYRKLWVEKIDILGMNEFALIPIENRPREKLLRLGAVSLSDQELISIIIGSGIKGKNVSMLSREVVSVIDQEKDDLVAQQLANVKGIGVAKATLMIASLEFARRRLHAGGTKIRVAQDVVSLLSHLKDRKQEHLVVVTLNGAHEVIKSRIITVGTANSTIAHPREIFNGAIKDNACAIVLAHNHPSGSCDPSEEDRKTTSRILEVGRLIGISLLDHVIFGQKDFYSFKDKGYI